MNEELNAAFEKNAAAAQKVRSAIHAYNNGGGPFEAEILREAEAAWDNARDELDFLLEQEDQDASR